MAHGGTQDDAPPPHKKRRIVTGRSTNSFLRSWAWKREHRCPRTDIVPAICHHTISNNGGSERCIRRVLSPSPLYLTAGQTGETPDTACCRS